MKLLLAVSVWRNSSLQNLMWLPIETIVSKEQLIFSAVMLFVYMTNMKCRSIRTEQCRNKG